MNQLRKDYRQEMNNYHTSVLLKETIELLNIKPGEKYIDATLGGGGHYFAIWEKGGIVLGIDLDQEALDYVREKIKNQKTKNNEPVTIKGNFKDIDKIAKDQGFGEVSGIIFDLGVSAHQLDVAKRGFSFQKEGPLDMRMDQDLNVQAKDLVNVLTERELSDLFLNFGEEKFARGIVKNIILSRKVKPIETTTELSGIIDQSVPGNKKIEAEARIFQALRIAINNELENIEIALSKAFNLLKKEGRIAVISFHSLEDRIVKKQFVKWKEESKGIILTKKPIVPGLEEIERNSKSRSAKLRVLEKL